MPKLTLEQAEILREVKMSLRKAQDEGFIISEYTFKVIDEVEYNYGKDN